jgi:hypothetical protein
MSASFCSARSFKPLYTATNSCCTLIEGSGIFILQSSLQSKVSLALPHELKRAYLSNSILFKSKNKYSGNNISVFLLLKIVYDR